MSGLRALVNYFSGEEKNPDQMVAYYMMSMIKLERKLIKDQATIEQVQQGLESIQHQSEQFDFSASFKSF